MNEFAREIAIGVFSSLMGALLGSLGTIAAFRVTLARLETRFDAWQKEMGRIDAKAERACTDSNRAWTRIRVIEAVAAERTEEHQRFEPRDTGEMEVTDG